MWVCNATKTGGACCVYLETPRQATPPPIQLGTLAEPARILILYDLNEKHYTVNNLAAALGMPQPTISRHLKVLRDHNLVEAIRRGIEEADCLRREAEQRVAEIEQRLRSLEGEVETLRAKAREEMTAENDRLQRETQDHLTKIRQQAEQ